MPRSRSQVNADNVQAPPMFLRPATPNLFDPVDDIDDERSVYDADDDVDQEREYRKAS